MKKSVIINLENNDNLSVKVFNEKLIPGLNICECCYVKVKNKSEIYSEIFNTALDIINGKLENNLTNEEEEFLYSDDCDYSIWISKNLLDKNLSNESGIYNITNKDVKTPVELANKMLKKIYKKHNPKNKKIEQVYNEKKEDNVPIVNLSLGQIEPVIGSTYDVKSGNIFIDDMLKSNIINLSDIIENNFDINKIFKLFNERSKKPTIYINKDVDNCLMELFDLKDIKDFKTMSLEDTFTKLENMLNNKDFSKFKKLLETMENSIKNGTLSKDKVWVDGMKKRTEELIKLIDITETFKDFGNKKDYSRKTPTTNRFSTNKFNTNNGNYILLDIRTGSTIDSIASEKVGTTNRIDISSIDIIDLKYNNRIKKDIYKIDMKFNKDVKVLLDFCYKFNPFSSKQKFYFTKEFLEYFSTLNLTKNKLNFKKINRTFNNTLGEVDKNSFNEKNGLIQNNWGKRVLNINVIYIDVSKENDLILTDYNEDVKYYEVTEVNNLMVLVRFFELLNKKFGKQNHRYLFSENAVNYFKNTEEFKNLTFKVL